VILAEPPPTQGDLHFRVAGTPVRIHPFFWLATLVLGVSATEQTPPAELVVWVVAVVVSILVHEFGHVVAQRYYGGHPRVVLHGFGGLAICGDCDRSPKAQVLISLAGPVAGFLFATLMMLIIRLVGHQAGVDWSGELTGNELGLQDGIGVTILGANFYWDAFNSNHVNRLVFNFIWINILWGLVNLLPIYPLDGGQVSRELCMLGQPRRGLILSLQLSMFAAGVMVLVGLLVWRSLIVPIFFAYLAYSSYRTLEAYRANQW
jgi:Zn-dependent protease